MAELPIILDGIIEEKQQNQIEDVMFDCSWKYFTDNVIDNHRKFLSPLEFNVTPTFISNITPYCNTKAYEKIHPLIKKGCDEIKFKLEKIRRCYGAIHSLMSSTSKSNTIHINSDIPHLVMLYYVNDSDGDTILYDKTVNDISYRFGEDMENYGEFNVAHRITPKKGRILFFDGRVYHAPSSPTKSVRCIVTLDLFGEFEDGSYKFPSPREEHVKNIIQYN